jgi:hypothetical protein
MDAHFLQNRWMHPDARPLQLTWLVVAIDRPEQRRCLLIGARAEGAGEDRDQIVVSRDDSDRDTLALERGQDVGQIVSQSNLRHKGLEVCIRRTRGDRVGDQLDELRGRIERGGMTATIDAMDPRARDRSGE